MLDAVQMIGWDVGGAHLKAACLDTEGRLQWVVQRPCPVWKGLPHLYQAIDAVLEKIKGRPTVHALTMTAELVDLFPDRATGVQQLVHTAKEKLHPAPLLVYAGEIGFVSPLHVTSYLTQIASANWHATASCLVSQSAQGLLIDIGSTTTDIIPFRQGTLLARGQGDRQRLSMDELVYTGVVRTPVMAVAQRCPLGGSWVSLAAEHFATMADAYRLLGWLPEEADQSPTADQAGKTLQESANRLARMLGCDGKEGTLADWQRCARHIAEQQLWKIQMAVDRVLSRGELDPDAPFIGAGVGRFLVERLASRMGFAFQPFSAYFGTDADHTEWLDNCAPAAAVARLALA